MTITRPTPILRKRYRIIPTVVPSNGMFSSRMVGASIAANRIRPVMTVTFLKPIYSPGPVRRHKLKARNNLEWRTVQGTLFQWGGVALVSHVSPYHPNEWIVSEFTTGRNAVVVAERSNQPKAGQRPTEHEARFEAVYFLQTRGLSAISHAIFRMPRPNHLTPEMRRHIAAIAAQQIDIVQK